jgi:hypothetical protein
MKRIKLDNSILGVLFDDLYFQVDVVDMAHHGGVECSSDLEQVFPKQITTIIYE